jgi:hypothetical protein
MFNNFRKYKEGFIISPVSVWTVDNSTTGRHDYISVFTQVRRLLTPADYLFVYQYGGRYIDDVTWELNKDGWGEKIRKNIYIVSLVKNFYHYDISSYIPNACLVLVVTFPCTCKHSFLYSLCVVSTPSTLLFMEQFMKHSIFKANNKTILHV